MKRFCLISSATALAALSLPAVANAEPAILYIPTEEVLLTPSGMDVCTGVSMSDYNSGLGCVPGLDAAGGQSPYGMAAAITTAMETALTDFDVMVTNTRPVDYIPFYTLLVSDMTNDESMGWTCTGTQINCESRNRNSIGFVNGGTMNCSNPDDVHAALYAFGNMAGLEAKVPPSMGMPDPDPMDYVSDGGPDYTNPATAYQDRCDDRAMPLGGEDGMTPQMPPCVSSDHAMCETSGQANSYQDLLQYFGARTMDTTAPTFTIDSPAMGDVIAEDGALDISVTVTDDDPIVGVKIIVTSPALEGVFDPPQISACTNNQCDVDFLDGNPFRAGDEPFVVPSIEGLPGGEYTITVEAADYHGNAAEMQTVTVTIEGDPAGGTDSGGSDSDTGDSDSDSGGSGITGGGGSTGGEDTDDGSGSDTASGDSSDDSGCGCNTSNPSGGAAMFLLGLLGLGLTRRRR
jgi:MYXO-CTERM domain-containing protein